MMRLLRLLVAVVVLALVALALRRIDFHALGAALASAQLGWVALAAAINFFHLFCAAERWRLLLSPVARVARGRLMYYLIVAAAASMVLPARAGEGLRLYLLRRRDQVPVGAAVGVLVAEKLLDVIGLSLVLLPLPLVIAVPSWARLSVLAVAAAGLVGAVLALGLARRAQPGSRWEALASGVRCLERPGVLAPAIGWAVVAVLVDAVEVTLCLRALGVSAPWATPGLVLLTLNLAIAVPSLPAHLGAFEAGAAAGLRLVGVPWPQAIAFGVIYHLMQVLPILLVGLSGLKLLTEEKR